MPKRRFDDNDLIRYAAGELDSQAEAAVSAYLADDGREHAASVARLRAAISTMRSDTSVEPSADAMDRYKAIFRPQPARGWLESARRVLADLVFDSRQQPALAGLRGGATAVQLAFECELAEIEMELEADADEGRWHVTGQATPFGDSGDEIRIGWATPGAAAPTLEATADEHGAFSAILGAGEYDMFVQVGDTVVLIPRLRVG
jgi:anti-sigma factor RsiW